MHGARTVAALAVVALAASTALAGSGPAGWAAGGALPAKGLHGTAARVQAQLSAAAPERGTRKKFTAQQEYVPGECFDIPEFVSLWEQFEAKNCPAWLESLGDPATFVQELPTMCQHECMGLMDQMLAVSTACAPEFIQETLQVCGDRPQCMGTAFLDAIEALSGCDVAFVAGPLFDFTNHTEESKESARWTCQTSCAVAAVTIAVDFGECLRPSTEFVLPPMPESSEELMDMAPLLALMCREEAGDVCSVRLKEMDRASCDVASRQVDEAACTADGAHCRWQSATATFGTARCVHSTTLAVLEALCTPCVTNIALYGASLLGTLAETAAVASYVHHMVCARVDGEFCMPLVYEPAFINNAATNMSDLSVTEEDARSFLDLACGTLTKKRCTSRLMGPFASTVRADAQHNYIACATGQNVTHIEEVCMPELDRVLKEVAKLTRALEYTCMKHDADDHCLALSRRMMSNAACAPLLGGEANATCSAECEEFLQSFIPEFGCCGDAVDKAYGPNAPLYDPVVLIPPVLVSNGSHEWEEIIAPPTQVPVDTRTNFEQHPMSFAQLCSSFNNDEFVTSSTTACNGRMTGEAPRRSVRLALAWSRLSADEDLKSKLLEALRTDMGMILGMPREDILEGVLAEDTTQTVEVYVPETPAPETPAPETPAPETETPAPQTPAPAPAVLVASSGVGSQLVTTSAGTQYSFMMRAESDEEAGATAATFDELVASGTLMLPTTQGVVQLECPDCGPQEGENIVATDSSSSGAAGVSAALAVAVAVAIAVVGL